MYSWDNFTTIMDFRNLSKGWDNSTAKRPSDVLIVRALDLIRKFIKTPEPKIYIDVAGRDTVIKFHWDIDWGTNGVGFIECTLSEDYLKLFVMDNESNVLVDNLIIDSVEYQSIDYVVTYFSRMISGEMITDWKERLMENN